MSKNALSQSHSVRKFPGKLFLRLVRQNRGQTQTYLVLSLQQQEYSKDREDSLVRRTKTCVLAEQRNFEHLLNLPRQF